MALAKKPKHCAKGKCRVKGRYRRRHTKRDKRGRFTK